jgi:arsenite methyltransferase
MAVLLSHMSSADIWSEWLLKRRFGGDAELMRQTMEWLYPIRERVLQNARLQDGDTLLDVGCGDGLIGFGALQQQRPCTVMFTDISRDLLARTRTIAEDVGVLDRCRVIQSAAERLAITDQSVDALTTRSVLIYVSAKEQAFKHFHRVLRPGGRLSIFEPINRFEMPEPDHIFHGFDVTPVAEIAAKVKVLYSRLQPLDSDPMMNFDERDLLRLTHIAGFKEIHLDLQVVITRSLGISWDAMSNSAGNPKIPTLNEAMREVLTAAETGAFVSVLRPLVETRAGTMKNALAYIWAEKSIS